jgi:hypothetical protein
VEFLAKAQARLTFGYKGPATRYSFVGFDAEKGSAKPIESLAHGPTAFVERAPDGDAVQLSSALRWGMGGLGG